MKIRRLNTFFVFIESPFFILADTGFCIFRADELDHLWYFWWFIGLLLMAANSTISIKNLVLIYNSHQIPSEYWRGKTFRIIWKYQNHDASNKTLYHFLENYVNMRTFTIWNVDTSLHNTHSLLNIQKLMQP